MKKYKLLILLSILFILLIPLRIKASFDAVISGNDVRVRSEATTSSNVLYSLNRNTPITVVDTAKISGAGCDSGWYKVIYKNTSGYVCSKYVVTVDNTFDGINVMDYSARVTGNNVSVRSGTSTSSSQVTTLSLGANVEILSTINATNGCSAGVWYKIQYSGTKTGYICKNYVAKKEDIIAHDEEYKKELLEKGFPESYIPYLTYLHKKYPKWTFIPHMTELNFATSVDMEEGKNYMQSKNEAYITSTTPAEGSSWYKVNSAVIAFYMDPRNWLTENRIFMFEDLKYIEEYETLYPSLVKSIFGSGKLSGDKYTIPMLNVAKSLSLSPLAIATRIRLEVGANGSASTSGESFVWKGVTYSGYYNFFNIGAYEATIDGVKVSAVKRGLLYAAKLINRSGELWNNVETAITEGSNTLANSYVKKGQDTLYYQKFNVSPYTTSSKYSHQYMTNIQAPATEGNQTYGAYRDSNTLDSELVFKIPVYDNMPEVTSLPTPGNPNCELSDIKIDTYSLSPKFDSDVVTYDVYIPTSITKINITATPESDLSTISGGGEIILESDETVVTLNVTAQSGNQKKYTITIHKVDDTTSVEEVIASSSYVINNTYLTKINNSTKIQTIIDDLIKNGAKSVSVTNSSNNIVSNDSLLATNQKITINTAIDTKSYTVVVKGDTSGDGNVTILDLLQVQKHIKKLSTLKNANFLAADTSGDGAVTILDLLQIQKHIKKVKSL